MATMGEILLLYYRQLLHAQLSLFLLAWDDKHFQYPCRKRIDWGFGVISREENNLKIVQNNAGKWKLTRYRFSNPWDMHEVKIFRILSHTQLVTYTLPGVSFLQLYHDRSPIMTAWNLYRSPPSHPPPIILKRRRKRRRKRSRTNNNNKPLISPPPPSPLLPKSGGGHSCFILSP